MKNLLSGTQNAGDLNQIISKIVILAQPVKIFLLSATYHFVVTENLLLNSSASEQNHQEYQLLVISPEGNLSVIEQEIKLAEKLKSPGLRIFVMGQADFMKTVEKDDSFVGHVILNSMMCYTRN